MTSPGTLTNSSNAVLTYEQVMARFPWLDYGTFAIPEAWSDVILWSRYFWLQNGDYRRSMRMVAAYFVTSLDMPDIDDEEKDSYVQFFEKSVPYGRKCNEVGADYLAYGEVFRSPYFPIRRFLRCTSCHFEQPVQHAAYTWQNFQFVRSGTCLGCGGTAPLERVDRKDTDMSKVRINRWDPASMAVVWNAVTEESDYFLRIPPILKKQIKDGVKTVIHTIPWEFVECVRDNADLMFDRDMIFHDYIREITGVMENGRGISPAVANFRLFWLIQTLNRQSQAIAMDYITGLRIYSPTPQTNVGNAAMSNDPVLNRGGKSFVNAMQTIINTHRMDPTRRFIAPHPVSYQFTGGEGKTIDPYDVILKRKEEMLHAVGVPVEFYKLNLTGQGTPMMLRLFEVMWTEIPQLYNNFLQWTVDHLVRRFKTQPTKISLKKTSVADDLEKKQAFLQLMSGNQISPATALSPWGIDDIRQEIRNTFKHQLILAEEQQRFDDEMEKKQEQGIMRAGTALPNASTQAQQAAGAGGDPSTGGAPPSPSQTASQIGGNPTLSDMEQQAQQIAQQIVALPDAQRKQELKKIRESNKTLHSLVMSALNEIRQQAASAGGYQTIQQNFGPGAAGGQPQ